MANIYLVRHGEKEFVSGDPGLTMKGREQAHLAALYLVKQNIGHIFSSPAKRTKETAEIINTEVKLPLVVISSTLRERLNWGDVPGQSFEDFMNEWEKTDIDSNYSPTIGNSVNKNGKFFKEYIDELTTKYPNKNLLFVTHGGTIGDLLGNIFPPESLPIICNNNTKAEYVEIMPGSVTVLEIGKINYRLVKVNQTSHLNEPEAK